jgi:hypothetical protein
LSEADITPIARAIGADSCFADACLSRALSSKCDAIQAPGDRRVFAPRHVAQLVAAPVDAHRVRIVRIVALADQLERVALAQLRPDLRGLAVTEARKR